MKEKEIKYLYDFLINDDDFISLYKESNIANISFEGSIENLIDYILYSYFNPYLDKKYYGTCWLEDKENNKVYNLDDIYDCYNCILEDSKESR